MNKVEENIRKVIDKWRRILGIEAYSFGYSNKTETLLIVFSGPIIDLMNPMEVCEAQALFHSELREVTSIELRYIKGYSIC